MTPRLLATLLLAAPLLAAAAGPTLCSPDETEYFNCPMGKAHKIASLCGHAAAPRYLQYRFGLVGQRPELQVPESLSDPAMGRLFFHEAARRADGREWSWHVWFHHANAIYQLSYFVDLDDEPQGHASVDYFIGRAEGRATSLGCASPEGGKALEDADDLIGRMSPPGRSWHLSPYDERLRLDQQAASAATR